MSNIQYTQAYNNKRKTKKITFDLYLDDEIEKKVYEIFNAQRENKNLKKYLIEIVKKHEKLE